VLRLTSWVEFTQGTYLIFSWPQTT